MLFLVSFCIILVASVFTHWVDLCLSDLSKVLFTILLYSRTELIITRLPQLMIMEPELYLLNSVLSWLQISKALKLTTPTLTQLQLRQ